MRVPLDVGAFLCIINLCIFVFILLFRRLHNLDVEVAASGFTRDMSESFDEVKTCEDTFIANREGREEMTHPSQVSYCNTFFNFNHLSREWMVSFLLNYLTRKSKLSSVIRRFDVSLFLTSLSRMKTVKYQSCEKS